MSESMTETSTITSVPLQVSVLVIGGGPAGSYAASVLAREGIDVLVLEAERFPRYHVGESQLASFRHFLRFIDLEAKFEAHGFIKKVGAAFKLNQQKREGYTDFISMDKNNYSWNVLRSEADHLMLQHVTFLGGKVCEETRVTDIIFDPAFTEPSQLRPIAARWKNKSGQTGTTAFNYLIDASGRAGILSVKYLRNRAYNAEFRNIAFWGYWSGCAEYKPGTPQAGSPYFEALTDCSGWAWIIPLTVKGSPVTSVGVVLKQEISDMKRKSQEPGKAVPTLEHYLNILNLAPTLKTMLQDATLIQTDDSPTIRTASDYSYSASAYAGQNYRIIGDAGAFIDPYFSSGVHLALSSALSAAATICAILRGDCDELQASRWHTARVDTSYTRFLVVVLGVYQHIRSQDSTLLSGTNEDNFDRAFSEFAPVIQGHIDSGNNLSANDMSKLVEFYSRHAYEPSTPEERRRLAPGPISTADPSDTSSSTHGDTTDAILRSMQVRKLFRIDDINHIDHFVADHIQGYRLRVQRGLLGLQKV